jgi:hypothetical protein
MQSSGTVEVSTVKTSLAVSQRCSNAMRAEGERLYDYVVCQLLVYLPSLSTSLVSSGYTEAGLLRLASWLDALAFAYLRCSCFVFVLSEVHQPKDVSLRCHLNQQVYNAYKIFEVYSNASTTVASGHTKPHVATSSTTDSSQTDGVAKYIMEGLGAQTENQKVHSNESELPALTGRPLPTDVPLNATWTSYTFASDTQRPDNAISWSSSMPKVEKCWSDIVEWRKSSVSWWNHNYAGRTVAGPVTMSTTLHSYNSTITTTKYPSSVSAYTLCDGSPRVDASPMTGTTVSILSTDTRTLPQIANWSTTVPIWSVPQPCDPSPEVCRLWYYHSNVLDISENELLQQCGRPTAYNESCVIQGGPIELIYWPVPPQVELCENNATRLLGPTAFASNTSALAEVPETITTLGHTFTSGTVYLSFSTLFASWDGFWDRVGPDFSDLIVPLPSSSIFTQCGGARYARNHGTPLNYADLNWPVPASAYSCQARCDPVGEPICPMCEHTAVPTTGECGTIWSDINPNLAMPTEIRDLVPEWSTCLMYNDRIPNFWFDPPIALTKQTAIAVPTAHVQPTTEPAAPSSTLPSAVPAETGAGTAYSETMSTKPVNEGETSKTSTSSEAIATTSDVNLSTSDQDDKDPKEQTSASQDSSTSEGRVSSEAPAPDGSAHASPTTVSSASLPTAVATSNDPVFTYDPTTSLADPETAIESSITNLDPTTSGSLDALSVLQSALSHLSSAEPTLKTAAEGVTTMLEPTTSGSLDALSVLQSALSHQDTAEPRPGSIGIDLGSGSVFFPLPTQASDAESPMAASQTKEGTATTAIPAGVILSASDSDVALSLGTDDAAIINPTRTTYVSLPEATISSLLSSIGSSDETDQQTTSTIASHDNSAHFSSQSGSTFIYSPLSPTSTQSHASDTTIAPQPPTEPPPASSQDPAHPTLLAFSSLTIKASPASDLPSALIISGKTLRPSGEALTPPQGEVLSYATSGLVAMDSSGGTQLLSTISVQNHTLESSSTGMSSEVVPLPSVIALSQPVDEDSSSASSSSDTNGEASATRAVSSTGASETGSEVANGGGRPVVRSTAVALVMFATAVFFV